MRVRLQFFGFLQEAAGTDHALLELPDRSTVADAVRAARGAIQGLARSAGASVRYAVNAQYVAETALLSEGDTLSFLPPVAGG